MQELQTFQAAARDTGFVAAEEPKTGTSCGSESGSGASTAIIRALCLDTMTNSGTRFLDKASGQSLLQKLFPFAGTLLRERLANPARAAL